MVRATKNEVKTRLLSAISSTNEVSRSDIAKHLGKRVLNPVELFLLQELVDNGAVVEREQPIPNGVGKKMMYRKA